MYTSTFLHDAKTWKTLEKPVIALIILKNKERVDFQNWSLKDYNDNDNNDETTEPRLVSFRDLPVITIFW